MKKVLIIGANSYIGNSFEKYINYKQVGDEDLAKDKIVIDKVSASNGDWERIDFFGYDVIIHMASVVHQREKKKCELEYYHVNRDIAIQVALKAKEAKAKQFIFMSSASVFGSKAIEINKNTQPMPDTLYGKTKLAAEQEIIKMQDDDFNVAIVRPPMVYGASCKGNFPRLIKLAKIVPIFPNIQNKRSMIYIDNLCEYLRLLIEFEESGYFHPQNSSYVCTSDMVKVISKYIDHRIYFIDEFNKFIKLLKKRVSSISKLFDNMYYDQNLDKINLNIYQVVDFEISILRSLEYRC